MNDTQFRPKETFTWFSRGRIYFSRDAERRFFFILTLAMAAFGLAVRFGVVQ
jgi:hypothetical protein